MPTRCPAIPAEAVGLAQSARALRQAARDGRLPPLLKGRKLGLLCDTPAQAEAIVVHQAALELGAHVSLVHPGFGEASDRAMLHTARTLGRLYDIVACLAVPPALVGQLRAAAGIPVLDDACVRAMGQAELDADERRYLWQAALAASLA
jgi:ornithine carbamoyltransferase